MPNVVILVVGMAIILLYILFNSTTGRRLDTHMLRSQHVGLNVVDFVPKGEIFPLLKPRGITRIKLPKKEEHLNLEEFISMAEKHDQDIVYRNLELAPWGYMEHYHVFSQDKTIGWIYNAGWRPR